MRPLTLSAAVLLAFLLLGGCRDDAGPAWASDDLEPGPPFRFNITALPAEYQPWFAEAADLWNDATGKTLIIIDPDGEHEASLADLPWGRLGDARCDGPACRVRLTMDTIWSQCGGAYDTPSTSLRGIAAHELGHVLGAHFADNPEDPVHSPVSADMMSLRFHRCEPLTARDIDSIPW